MYESYWKLESAPFSYRPTGSGLYRSHSHQASSLRLRYCFANNAGAAMLLGNSGVGKSSLLQQLRAEEQELRPFAHIAFPTLAPTELLRAVVVEVTGDESLNQLPTDGMLLKLGRFLEKNSAEGRHAVIAFDEANLLPNDSLNQVVLPLLNFADTHRRLSFSVVLCGQPVLASYVARNAQLRERIAVKATLESFTAKETTDYIQSRMLAAGAEREVFREDAIRAIIDLSGGNPRRINRLCDMALLVGYADQIESITAREVEGLEAEFLPAAA